jgi:MFS family permease
MSSNAQVSQLDSETQLETSRVYALGMSARIAEFVEHNRFLLVFAVMSSFMGVTVGMAQVTTSLYAVKLGCSGTMLGLIAGSQSVGVLVMSLPVGMLVDRFGPARLFVLGTVLSGATYAVMPLGASPGHLLLCTTAISFFMPLRFVSLNTLFLQQLATLGEAKAGWYRGTHMAGMYLLGPVIAAIVVGWLGYAGSYWLIAITFGLTALISRIVFGPYASKPNVLVAFNLRSLRAQLSFLVGDRELRRLSLVECLNQAISAYFTFFIVVIAVSVAHLGTERASSLVSAKGLTYIVALFALGGIVRGLGATRAYLTSFTVAAGGLAVLGCAASPGLLWFGSLALGLGLGTLQIANLTRYARVGHRVGHGTVSGINALAGPTGGILGNLCGGIIGGFFSLQAVFLAFAAVLLLAGLPLLRQLRSPQLGRI